MEARKKKEAAAKILKEAEGEFKAAQSDVIGALEQLDKSENEGSFGKVKVVQREYFKMVDKEAAMNWLKERGEFEALASVNANTYSSHVKGLVHEKREEGDFVWVPPGTEDATSDYRYLKVTEK